MNAPLAPISYVAIASCEGTDPNAGDLMRTPWLVASTISLIVATGAPAVAGAQTSDYPQQVSDGAVTLTLEPQWQDTALVVVVRAEVRAGSGGDLRGISLLDQVMLMCERQTHQPYAASPMSGRKALAWVAFRLPRKPVSFALSIRDVPDVPLRIIRWPEVALTP